jgi:hypothetical protein
MILLTGALVSGVLGFRLTGQWVPAALACVALALQAVAYRDVLGTADDGSGFIQIMVMTGLMSLFLFYALFSMGRSLGLKWRKRR